MKKSAPVATAAVLALFALFALSSCASSGGPETSSSAGGHAAMRSAMSSSVTASTPVTADSVEKSSGIADRAGPALLPRQVISTGSMSLNSMDVATARQKVLDLVVGWHGTVADEQATSSPNGAMKYTHLTLRVPSATFDTAMAALAGVAHVTSQQRSAEDVTTKVIDIDARVQAKKRAVQQLEQLLNRATTLGQVISLEGDISERQAELESLQHQQTWLRDQTSLSTINLTITRTAAARSGHTDHAWILGGLWSGLDSGWQALGSATTVVLTTIGAVFPFAIILAVIGIPLWLLRRGRRGKVTPAQAE